MFQKYGSFLLHLSTEVNLLHGQPAAVHWTTSEHRNITVQNSEIELNKLCPRDLCVCQL